MKLNQLALQLFTLRDFLGDARQIGATLRKVREIGFTAIEYGSLPIPEDELSRILAAEGLRYCGFNDSSEAIRKRPAEVAERAVKLGCQFVTCAYLPDFQWDDRASIDILIQDLAAAGKVFRRAGITLLYHNHASEFVRIGDTTVLDYIFSNTNPEELQAELDTYWVQYGGGNPAAWCRKMKGRLPLLHLKDYGFTVEYKPAFQSIGSGNLDWKEIIPAAEEAGCRWFIVEQDSTPEDPFLAVGKSFRFLAEHFIAA